MSKPLATIAMTDQHRATPDQWHNLLQYLKLDRIPDHLSITLELAARIEALEAAQLEQAESHRFCTDAIVRRVEALEAKPAAWRPLETETTYGSKAAADAVQLLRSPMVVQGTFEHGGETYRFKAKPEREDPMTELRAASAEARPAKGLVLRVSEANNSPDAIRTVAAWLREGRMLNAAELLEQEADRG